MTLSPRLAALMPPSWVMPRAKFDLAFAEGKYYGGSIMPIGQGFGNSRLVLMQGNVGVSGGALANAGHNINIFPSSALRITPGYGLWIEANTSNVCLQSRDYTNASWVKTTMTAAKTQTGADGTANGCSLLTATGANATALQTLGSATATKLFHVFMKAGTVTGPIYVTCDGSLFTDISSSLSTSVFNRVATPTVAFTATAPIVGIKIANSGDSVIVDFSQCETNTVPSGPLVTTTVSVSRGNEEPVIADVTGSHPNDGTRLLRNILQTGSPYSGFISYSGTPPVGSGWLIASDLPIALNAGAGGTSPGFTSNSVTATAGNTANAGIGNMNKICFRANGAGVSICLNGGTIVTTSSTSAMIPASDTGSHIGLGNNGSGLAPGPLGGCINRFALFNDMSDFEMVAYSDLASRYGN